MNEKQRFTNIFNHNLFLGQSSRSGEGSSLEQTEILREEMSKLFLDLNINSILDAPCGDWHWMKEMDLSDIDYLGVDIVDEIIENNMIKYEKANIKFESVNIIEDALPKVDLIFCRDCLVHLTNYNVFRTLNNFKRSGSKYLLTTTFPGLECENIELIEKNIWRPLNLELDPFNFPKPIRYINERGFGSPLNIKTSALWKLDTLEVYDCE